MDGTHTGKLSAESVRAALRRVRGSALNFVPRDCEAEARPADETAEAEQGQRSAFCKRASARAEKNGHRNQEEFLSRGCAQKWVPPKATHSPARGTARRRCGTVARCSAYTGCGRRRRTAPSW